MKNRKETISRFERNILIREGGKCRYYFFDYLYYRLFVLYRKYNEPARFSACGVLCLISLIALFFFCIFLASVLPDYWIFTRKNFTPSQGAFIGGCVSVLCFVAFYLRYNRTFEIQGQQVEQDNPDMDNTFSSSNHVPDRNMDR